MREVFFQSKTASKPSCICNGGSQSTVNSSGVQCM